MVCEHLAELEKAMLEKGIKVRYRGKTWTDNCREFVYFDCYLDKAAIRKKFELAECVVDYDHLGTLDGQEAGFYCQIHHDGIMGDHKYYCSMRNSMIYSGT